ncbi:MAG: MarR family transcriptional regulator [Alphaproteobacteria bacterium]|nr:MarR family transcriptional regulator [Alphaproteobacteria bacterium]
MTEIIDKNGLPEPIERFVVHWGEMGTVWGVNRSVAQIHALLFVSDNPRTAENIAETLSLARSNVSNSIKELMAWNLIRRVQVLGDRRDYFEAEADMFEMVRRIANGRKQREIDPTIALLRECVGQAEGDKRVSENASKRLNEMLGFMETVEKGFSEIIRLPAPTLMRLMSMGGAIAKFVAPRKKQKD